MALVCSLAVPAARRREQCGAVCNRVIPAAALLPKPELCVHVLRQAAPTCAPMHREWWLKAQYHFPHTSSPAHPSSEMCCVHQDFCFSCVFPATQGPLVFAHLVVQHSGVYREITTNLPQPGTSQTPPAAAGLLMGACNAWTCKGPAG